MNKTQTVQVDSGLREKVRSLANKYKKTEMSIRQAVDLALTEWVKMREKKKK